MTLQERFKNYFDKVEKENTETPFYKTLRRDEALKEFSENENAFGIVLSDSISTKDVKTTANSKMLENYVPAFDATVAKKLKDAGGVLLGKTITLEFGVGEAETTFGTNIAVDKGEDIIGLTIDSKGFMHLGAFEFGLKAFTPTFGLVSRYGLLVVASSIDRIGILAKDFKEIQKATSIIVGKDEKDSLSIESTDNFKDLEDLDLSKLTVAKLDKFGHFVEEAEFLESLNINVEEKTVSNLEYSLPTYEILSSGEFATNMEKYDSIGFGHRTNSYSSLDELYKNSRTEGFGRGVQEKIVFGNFVLSENQYENYYVQAMKARTLIRDSFYKVLEDTEFLIAPISLYYTAGINLSGLPSISIPYGNEGILITTRAFNDKRLLSFAKELIKEMDGEK